jgi:hypothetical protein
LGVRLTTLLCKKLLLGNRKKRKPDGLRHLAESSEEGHGSKRAVILMMMMITFHIPSTYTYSFFTYVDSDGVGSIICALAWRS